MFWAWKLHPCLWKTASSISYNTTHKYDPDIKFSQIDEVLIVFIKIAMFQKLKMGSYWVSVAFI